MKTKAPKVSRTAAILRSRLLMVSLSLIVICTLAWQTRHQWLPSLANFWLDGAKIEQLSGVQLSPSHGGSIDVQGMQLQLNSGLRVRIEALSLREVMQGVTRLIHGSPAPEAPDTVRKPSLIVAEKVTVLPPPDGASASASESGKTEQAALPDAETDQNGPQSPGANPPSPASDTTPLRLSELLDLVQKLPPTDLDIRQLQLADLWSGAIQLPQLSAPFQFKLQNRGGHLSGHLLNRRCSACQLQFQLTHPVETAGKQDPVLEVALGNRDTQAATFKLTASRSGTAAAAGNNNHQAANAYHWKLQSDLQIHLAPLQVILGQLDIQLSTAELKAYQATGDIRFQINANAPDEILQLQKYKAFNAELLARTLQFQLPADVAGAPLAASVRSLSPLRWSFEGLQSLKAEKLSGALALELDSVEADATGKGTEPNKEKREPPPQLLVARAEFSNESGHPGLWISGDLHPARAQPLFATDPLKSLVAPHDIRDIDGALSFRGHLEMPSLSDWRNTAPVGAAIRNLELEALPGASLTATVVMPAESNPLRGIGWSRATLSAETRAPTAVGVKQWPGPVTLTSDSLDLTVSGTGTEEKHTDFKGAVTNVRCEDLLNNRCSAQIAASIPTLELPDSKTRAESVDLSLKLQVSSSTAPVSAGPSTTTTSTTTGSKPAVASQAKAHQVQINDLNLTAKAIQSGAVEIRDAEFFASALQCARDVGRSECSSDQLAIAVSPLSMIDSQVEGVLFLDQFTLKTNLDRPPEISTRYRAHNLIITSMDAYSMRLDPTGEATLKQGVLKGKSRLEAGNIQLESTWQHSLDTGSGQLSFNLPGTAFSPQQPLSNVIQGIPADIAAGQLAAAGKLHWPAQNRDRLQISLHDATAIYGDTFVVGINGSINLTRDNRWQTTAPTPIQVQRIDAGVAVKNLHFTLALTPEQDIKLDGFAAELLDGVLTASTLRWNLNGEPRASQVNFTGLSLRKLAEEMEAENFAASGLVDATIPLEVDKQGITVENGTVQSRPGGGRLRYYGAFSPQMLTANPQLKLIAGALEDYEYRELKGTFSYPLNGDLTLNLKLTGRSDAVDANRDLIINLNLENNIPQMLRSLQASRNLQDVLENQVP